MPRTNTFSFCYKQQSRDGVSWMPGDLSLLSGRTTSCLEEVCTATLLKGIKKPHTAILARGQYTGAHSQVRK